MPKRIPFIQGNYYHIYNRGAGRQPIFHEAANYAFLLRRLKSMLTPCGSS